MEAFNIICDFFLNSSDISLRLKKILIVFKINH